MKFDEEQDSFVMVKKNHEHYTGWLFEDKNRQLWEVQDNGIRKFDTNDSIFIPFKNNKGELQQIPAPYHVTRDKRGSYWIATHTMGIFLFDAITQELTNYNHKPSDFTTLSYNWVNHILVDHENNVWIAADNGGLDLFNRSTQSFYHYKPQFNGIENINPKPYYLYEDKSKGLWMSHYHSGIAHAGYYAKKFKPYFAKIGAPESLNSPYVMGFFERSNGDIWIATDGGGVNLWHRSDNRFSHFKHDPTNNNSIGHNTTGQIVEDQKGYVWIRRRGGIDRLNHKSGKIKRYSIHGVLALTPDGNLWLNSRNTLMKYNGGLDTFEQVLQGVYGMTLDREDNLWIGTSSNTFCKYVIATNETTDCFESNAYAFADDSKGNIWMLLPPQGDTLIKYNSKTQVYSDTVALVNARDHLWNTLIVDKNDHVWLGTKDGLYRYQPEKKQLKHFDYSDGLASNFLRFGLPIETSKGELLFGSSRGFTIFHPDSIKENTFVPPVLITNFQIGAKEVPVAGSFQDTLDWASPLEQHIHFAEKVKVRHFQNDFSFEFAALDYTNPQKNQYKYKLEGYDDSWITTDAANRLAKYTNLSPGTYTFQVQGSNDDGLWNTEGTSLQITILPPWYWAWWSKTLYVLLLAGMLYVFYRFQLNRQLATAEAQRLKELDSFKTRLYTNITHEFRTPLTVISGMADQVLDNPKKWFQEGLTMIKRNSRQLLSLVNQMLDLSKLEAGTLPLNLIQDDLVGYLNYLTESFHSYAESKDIRLHFLPDTQALVMDYDPEKVRTIFTNLIGNAIKFTPAGGDVYIKLQETQDRYCQIEVTDTGIGISEEELPHIFDRFYQADDSVTRQAEGTGIGLALTKELVKLLDGTIEVQSQPGKGATFTVQLPIRREAPTEKTPMPSATLSPDVGVATVMSSSATISSDNELPVALLIEDNRDVLHYLASCLEGQYRLEKAANGQEGIEQAIDLVPDIIISDVMMPKKDGFEVVHTLKNDERTSHIPIILLTAKADVASRIEGLGHGADAYLAKPFDQEELEVRLQKLIELRQKLQARYSSFSPDSGVSTEAETKEDAFLRKVKEAVEEHLEKEDFGIAQLCRIVGVSRTQLHRKLKALTGKSTSLVIRSIRLQKAKQLLQSSDLNVSEIGYAVGFSNRSYFTQAFTEEFGESPSHYRES